ncbi:septal ring lytic transglycosylase RlpA family protein [Acidobacteria bacterium AH-259-D05]|nr:septal ring lytic transglycosylase RlpA family protein [Acidobacteria bacterium AH-259-D05]
MRILNVLLIGLLVVCSGCGKKPPTLPLPTSVSRGVQRGLASWYGKGDGYHGKITASGERFDRNKLTAAHFDLPLGTRLRVRNLNNGREVIVRVNDRFPVSTLRKGRIIDLSYQAARVLQMVQAGVVPVTLEVVSKPGH